MGTAAMTAMNGLEKILTPEEPHLLSLSLLAPDPFNKSVLLRRNTCLCHYTNEKQFPMQVITTLCSFV